ncbi:CPBP family intramembrane glutamic endopeptidase [Rathayibacter sp. YIM 133350]|uniref:CPBP family intramembrane glutamic endopeptidase n=1 Tax=Rathayibacter sp. YIM 133350 TaxID=3131992 RepID=UPI00307E5329
MSEHRMPAAAPTPRDPHWGVGTASVGVLLALLGVWALGALTRTVVMSGPAALVLSYAVVWVPLMAVALWACFARGTGSLVRDFGLRFTWLDLLWGVGLGLVLRAIATIVEIAVYGGLQGNLSFGEPANDFWWLFGGLLAPVLIAPFIEEVYFRGLMQRALTRATARLTGSGADAAADDNALVPPTRTGFVPRIPWLAVVVTSIVFSLLHVATTSLLIWQSAVVVGVATLIFGLAVGVLTALTGRIGGAIIAHVVYNGMLVLVLGM